MSEVKLSKRAEQVLSSLRGGFGRRSNPENMDCHGTDVPRNDECMAIRQATLAEQLGCSRWTIGRAIKRLKEAGLLVELKRRHTNRCKMYRVAGPLSTCGEGFGVREPTPLGASMLQHCRYVFECNLGNWPDWEKHYAAVTWEFEDVHCPHKLWRKTFDRLYVLRHRETGIPIPVIT